MSGTNYYLFVRGKLLENKDFVAKCQVRDDDCVGICSNFSHHF